MATQEISLAELQRMLADIDVPDAQIRPFLVESAEESSPLNPVVKINPTKIDADLAEAAVALSSLNGVARWRRQRQYRRKIGTWQGVRIVSEGDSWFQYPFLLDDVIDQLFDAYAILSLDAAGDLLSDMVRQNELVSAVVQERPDLVLLSGGGNDLLGGSRLARVLPSYEPSRGPEAYLGDEFEANLRQVIADYETLVMRLGSVAPTTRILCHSYDHAIPANGRWLGRPLAAIGIAEPRLQREIIRCIVDRFHQELSRLAERHANVRLVDCRGVVDDKLWHDELHPANAGFRAVAVRFARAIGEATGTPAGITEAMSAQVGTEAVAPAPASSLSDQALALLSTYSEPVLLREIGRRKMLADAEGGDGAADSPLLVYRTSVEGVFPEQLALGRQIADAAAHALPTVLADVDDRARPDPAQTLREGDGSLTSRAAASLSGHAGLSASASALLAAVLVSRHPSIEQRPHADTRGDIHG
jgi:lysophospholipase L1-like esterase